MVLVMVYQKQPLKEPIEVGIARGLKKYEEENRKVNLFVYLTYFAKNLLILLHKRLDGSMLYNSSISTTSWADPFML